jgi:glycosyltransferase involved in cell wall biosynthesis
MPAPRLSVILPTGDVIAGSPGRAVFERVLASVGFADELVVVDSDSRDETRAIAAAHGAQVIVHPYQNSLKLQKQVALRHVTGDWVLWVDADEVLPAKLAAEIRAAIAAPQANAYRISRQHVFAGKLLRHAGEDAPLRLWRRGEGHWDGIENDEFYVVDPPIGRFETPLEHYSTARLADRLRKMAFFAPAHAATLPLPPTADYSLRDAWRRLLRPPVQRFYGVYWVERGYRDGIRGLLWALLCSVNELFIHALLWERAQAAPAAAAAGAEGGDHDEARR